MTWTYAGISSTSPNGSLYDIELIKRDLQNAFETRLGELDWAPDRGSILHSLIHELQTEENRQLIFNDVERILRSDPRIILKTLSVITATHGYLVQADVEYRELNTAETLRIEFDRRNFSG